MSHFSRIKTSIKNKNLLKETLRDLEYLCNECTQNIYDSDNNMYTVDITVTHNSQIYGFAWDGKQYNFIADLQLWNYDISLDAFMDKILQRYAINSIKASSITEGFKSVVREKDSHGRIQITLEKWQ